MMTTPSPALLEDLHWRYATKKFDAERKIPAETWRVLEESLVLTPSSYGLQPWRFFVITDPAMKEELLPHSWHQKQVVDCSHLVVFASKTTLDSGYVDANLERAAELRKVPVDSMKHYRGMIIESLVHDARSGVVAEWAARQVYIALGQFMLAAAVLRVDACPLEGFVPAEYDNILGLTAQGLTASVCCAAGYRSEHDKYAHIPKVRFPVDKIVTRI